jgi:glycosyltransferase involved in cell wall biosynthesis
MKPLVSVIINNCNYGRFLPRAIDSALGQTYSPIEVIVVDDGSTDNSREILNTVYANRVKALFQENKGQAEAINLGYAACKGDIVIFLDSDDVLMEDAVGAIVRSWNPGASKVGFSLVAIDENNKELSITVPRAPLARGDVTQSLMRSGHYVTPPTSGNAFSRAALARVMPIPANWLYGDAYLLHAVPFFGPVEAHPKPLGFYRIHNANISGQALQTADIALQKMKTYLVTELRVRDLLEKLAESRGSKLAPQAILTNYSFLKAQLAFVKLGGSLDSIRLAGVVRTTLMLIKAAWLSSALNLPGRCVLAGWALATCVVPGPAVMPVLRAGLSPAYRPEWFKKAIVLLSRNKSLRRPAVTASAN